MPLELMVVEDEIPSCDDVIVDNINLLFASCVDSFDVAISDEKKEEEKRNKC